jgi:Sec-independent protein secretion pathway component TatC
MAEAFSEKARFVRAASVKCEIASMRSVIAQLSTLSFVLVCVAASFAGIVLFPTVVAVTYDLIGLSTEAPLSNFVGWSMLISAAVGLVFPATVLMTARGEFD